MEPQKNERQPLRINKGIGKPVEFLGLQGQYIYHMVIGLVGNALLSLLIYLAGIPGMLVAFYLVVSSPFIGFKIFARNKKYGLHGSALMRARDRQPKRIAIRNPTLIKVLRWYPII